VLQRSGFATDRNKDFIAPHEPRDMRSSVACPDRTAGDLPAVFSDPFLQVVLVALIVLRSEQPILLFYAIQ
jgi:hypothetical protein